MDRLILVLLCVGVFALSAGADEYNRPNVFIVDGQEVLPRWASPADMIPPAGELDEITPPPENPVTLEGEFEPKQGMILRWPFGKF